MEHDALLRTVELSDCKVFIDWFEETQTEVFTHQQVSNSKCQMNF